MTTLLIFAILFFALSSNFLNCHFMADGFSPRTSLEWYTKLKRYYDNRLIRSHHHHHLLRGNSRFALPAVNLTFAEKTLSLTPRLFFAFILFDSWFLSVSNSVGFPSSFLGHPVIVNDFTAATRLIVIIYSDILAVDYSILSSADWSVNVYFIILCSRCAHSVSYFFI